MVLVLGGFPAPLWYSEVRSWLKGEFRIVSMGIYQTAWRRWNENCEENASIETVAGHVEVLSTQQPYIGRQGRTQCPCPGIRLIVGNSHGRRSSVGDSPVVLIENDMSCTNYARYQSCVRKLLPSPSSRPQTPRACTVLRATIVANNFQQP